MSAQTLIPALATAFIVTVSVMLAMHPFAIKIGLVDHLGGRKRHDGAVPVIGGLAMFAGIAVGLFLIGPLTVGFLSALIAGGLLIIIGAIDDNMGLPPATRVITQIAVVLVMVYGANLQLVDIGDPFGTGVISMGRFGVIFTLVVSLTLINAYNLVDGIDGLAGTLATIALLAVVIVAGPGNVFGAAALIAVATVLGFLMFNFPIAKNRSMRSFMGDAGSTLLGFTIVWVTLGIAQGAEQIISPVHCLWFAAVPIFDCLTCFVRRSLKGKSPFTPGRDHFHHMLRRGGFGVRETLAILASIQFTYATIGLAGFFIGVPDYVMFAAWSAVGLTQIRVIRRIAKSHRLYSWSRIRSRDLTN